MNPVTEDRVKEIAEHFRNTIEPHADEGGRYSQENGTTLVRYINDLLHYIEQARHSVLSANARAEKAEAELARLKAAQAALMPAAPAVTRAARAHDTYRTQEYPPDYTPMPAQGLTEIMKAEFCMACTSHNKELGAFARKLCQEIDRLTAPPAKNGGK